MACRSFGRHILASVPACALVPVSLGTVLPSFSKIGFSTVLLKLPFWNGKRTANSSSLSLESQLHEIQQKDQQDHQGGDGGGFSEVQDRKSHLVRVGR